MPCYTCKGYLPNEACSSTSRVCQCSQAVVSYEKPGLIQTQPSDISILCWNIQELGGGRARGPVRKPEEITGIANTILENDPDVVAIVEVMSKCRGNSVNYFDTIYNKFRLPEKNWALSHQQAKVENYNNKLAATIEAKDLSELCTILPEILEERNKIIQGTSFDTRLNSTAVKKLQDTITMSMKQPEVTRGDETGRAEIQEIVTTLNLSPLSNKNYDFYCPKNYTGGETYAVIYDTAKIIINKNFRDYINIYKGTSFNKINKARLPYCFDLQFKNRATQLNLIVWHAPYTDEKMRICGIKKLDQAIQAYGKNRYPTILMGDFNCTDDEQLNAVADLRETTPTSAGPALIRAPSFQTYGLPTNYGKKPFSYDHMLLYTSSGDSLNSITDKPVYSQPVSRDKAKCYSDHCPIFSRFKISGYHILSVNDVDCTIGGDAYAISRLRELLSSSLTEMGYAPTLSYQQYKQKYRLRMLKLHPDKNQPLMTPPPLQYQGTMTPFAGPSHASPYTPTVGDLSEHGDKVRLIYKIIEKIEQGNPIFSPEEQSLLRSLQQAGGRSSRGPQALLNRLSRRYRPY